MLIRRLIQQTIEKNLFSGRAIVIYGPRQSGKTTLIQEIQKKYGTKSIYLNCDEPDIRSHLTNITSTAIKDLIGDNKIIFLDEAQRVENIGLTIKLAVDNFPYKQIVATGSSSFDLSNKISEPLTGRKYEYYLYPLSLEELFFAKEKIEIQRTIETRMIYGMYPHIVTHPDKAESNIKEIAKSYLYQDVLQYQQIKNSDILHKLLQALALQIGQEVSYNELANTLGIDKKTVSRYIDLLEKSFVITSLKPFSRNLRSELTKMRKIYFWDTGVRNAVIRNFNPLYLRQDVGSLWENLMIVERLKYNLNHSKEKNMYFWRTHQQQEIDYIEEERVLNGYEFKWGKKLSKCPKSWSVTYPGSTYQVINQDNYLPFVGVN